MTLHRRLMLIAVMATGAVHALRPALSQQRTIPDAMAADGRFTRFLSLVQEAGLTETLHGPGPMTVFAPVDTAFTGAPTAGLLGLLGHSDAPVGPGVSFDRTRAQGVARYHLVTGAKLDPNQLAGDQRLTTANGNQIRVVLEGGVVTVSNPGPVQRPLGSGAGGTGAPPPAQMTGSEIPARNGVVIPISRLLYP